MELSQYNKKTSNLYRKLLGLAGLIYLSWWIAVDQFLPQSFNPLSGRLIVVSTILSLFLASYVSSWIRRHIRGCFIFSAWLITLHYFYLFYGNAGDPNWIVGCYITVIAINFSLLSNGVLLCYSVFVLLLSALLVFLVPSLQHSVFFPGLFTIVLQANIGLRSRLSLIKGLTQSKERFELLFNSIFEGVLVHEKGRILDINEPLLKMLGFSREELINTDLLNLLHPEERKVAEEKIRIGDQSPYETRALSKEQKIIEVKVRAKDFIHNNHPVRLVTVQDIADQKRAEKERIFSLTLTENLRIRDDFITIASHELKTPISSLLLQAQLLERDLNRGSLPEKLKEPIGLFNRQIERLTELIDTMLDVSRIAAGRLTMEPQKMDVRETIYRAVHSLENSSAHDPLFSPIEINAPESIILWADPYRLEQVVENLLTNALKYGERKPIAIHLNREEKEVILAIEDHGLGIAPEFTSRIFERFERAVSSRNITGFGLGLYIARQIIEAHGGSIQVESLIGAGSTFTVRIPIKSAELAN